jgi:hypothetical protein
MPPTASPGVERSLHVPTTTDLNLGSVDQRFLTQSEKRYFGAARSYLEALNEGDAALAAIVASVRNGRAELNSIKAASERTRTQQSDLYAKHFINLSAPSGFATTHRKLQSCEVLHDTAIDELLRYWRDSIATHLQKGTADLGAAIAATNDAATDLKATTARIVSARKRMARTRNAGSGSSAGSGDGSQSDKGSAATPTQMQPVDPYPTGDGSKP